MQQTDRGEIANRELDDELGRTRKKSTEQENDERLRDALHEDHDVGAQSEHVRLETNNNEEDPVRQAQNEEEKTTVSLDEPDASPAILKVHVESAQHDLERRKMDTEKEGHELPACTKKEVKTNTSPELNYISFVNIAIQRHKDKLCDLTFEEIVRKPGAASNARFGTRCKLNLRKPDGNIERPLEADGWHEQRRKSKHKACEQMIVKLKGIIEGLSYRPVHRSDGEKKEPPLPEGKKKNVTVLAALKDKGIITEGPKYDFLAVDLDQDADKDNFNYGQKVWRTTCTVKLRHWQEFIIREGQHRKKNDSKHDAANKVVEEIGNHSTPEIEEFLEKIGGRTKKLNSNEDAVEQRRDENEKTNNISSRKPRRQAQQKITLLDKIALEQGDDFQLPDEYKITMANSQDLCQKWHRETLEPDGEDVGVYFESKSMSDMLEAPSCADGQIADIVALTATRGALLCVRPDEVEHDEWPPLIIKELLFDIAYPKVAMFPPKVFNGIVDLQQYAYALTPETIERVSPGSVHLSLERMVYAFLNKAFEKLYDEDNQQLDVRYQAAVKVAAATLAVYTKIKRLADAKIRSETGVASMPGFLDLAEKLMCITPLSR